VFRNFGVIFIESIYSVSEFFFGYVVFSVGFVFTRLDLFGDLRVFDDELFKFIFGGFSFGLLSHLLRHHVHGLESSEKVFFELF